MTKSKGIPRYVKINTDPTVKYEIVDGEVNLDDIPRIYIGDKLAPCPKGVRQKI